MVSFDLFAVGGEHETLRHGAQGKAGEVRGVQALARCRLARGAGHDRKCNIRNYSIYHKDGYLFSYFEYHGEDLAADMAKMAADPATQRWWAICNPCQEPLPTRAPGEWWAQMEEVFHTG